MAAQGAVWGLEDNSGDDGYELPVVHVQRSRDHKAEEVELPEVNDELELPEVDYEADSGDEQCAVVSFEQDHHHVRAVELGWAPTTTVRTCVTSHQVGDAGPTPNIKPLFVPAGWGSFGFTEGMFAMMIKLDARVQNERKTSDKIKLSRGGLISLLGFSPVFPNSTAPSSPQIKFLLRDRSHPVPRL